MLVCLIFSISTGRGYRTPYEAYASIMRFHSPKYILGNTEFIWILTLLSTEKLRVLETIDPFTG